MSDHSPVVVRDVCSNELSVNASALHLHDSSPLAVIDDPNKQKDEHGAVDEQRAHIEFSIAAHHTNSPIHRLPVELLLVIFQFACSGIDDVLFPELSTYMPLFRTATAISSVCALWRSVSLPGSSLWYQSVRSNIALGYSYARCGRNMDRTIYSASMRMMFSHLPWAKPTALRIHIIGTPLYAKTDAESRDYPHSNNIPQDVFSCVRSLSIYKDRDDTFSTSLSRVPLSHLRIHHLACRGNLQFRNSDISQTDLRTLWLEDYGTVFTIDAALAIFSGRLEATLHRCAFQLRVTTAPPIVCNVVSLHVSHWGHPDSIEALFQHFTFPHLSSLTITAGTNDPTTRSLEGRVLTLAMAQCPSLAELKLKDVVIRDIELVEALSAADQLVSLSFIESAHCSPWKPTLTPPFLERLRNEDLVPGLQKLELVFSVEWGIEEKALMDMLDARSSKFTSVIVGRRCGQGVMPSTEKRLSDLRARGVSVTLW